MTIEDLKETAEMAHLNPDKDEQARLFPAFTQMVDFFDIMQTAQGDKAAFPKGLASVSSALAGASGNYRAVNSGFYRSGVNASSKNNGGADNASSALIENMLDNAGERDGRFFVIPNVL